LEPLLGFPTLQSQWRRRYKGNNARHRSFVITDVKKSDQPSLFESAPALPEGFEYRADFISADEEAELVEQVKVLPFKDFEFQGFIGKRRVVSFGWRYDFNERELQKADDIPSFLLPLRKRAANISHLGPADLRHVLVTEYAPGAAIGWHRDKAVFAEVVGVSLLAPCRFRFRREKGGTWERAAIIAEPRSAYLLAGAARTEWEHSIPPVDRLRYSITFRNFRERT
jgi:alkylated DNA repair dioxygenase AlkB